MQPADALPHLLPHPDIAAHLDENRDPRLLTLIRDRIKFLLSALYPGEVSEGIYRSMDSDLKYIVGRYTSQKLRDCDDLFIEIRVILFSSFKNFLRNVSL